MGSSPLNSKSCLRPCHHPTTQFFTGRVPFLPPSQQHQSTEGNIPTHTYTHRDNSDKQNNQTQTHRDNPDPQLTTHTHRHTGITQSHTLTTHKHTAWDNPDPPHTYTHVYHLSRTTQVSQYQKVEPTWILLKQETVSGSGISWAICKSAPRSRQITTPPPNHSDFTGRMPFLPPNQQNQSIEGNIPTHTPV